MAATMKIDIISRETIKPSSPTPPHLRNFKLSFIDQTAPVMYTGVLLFYLDSHVEAVQKSQQLKESLSKMLTGLYPLAGTIKDQTTIECNDEGAEYIEARVNCSLSSVLENPDSSLLRIFLPVEVESTEADTGRVLFVQASIFECGGIAIGVCISHKIADAATLGTVIKSWAKAVREPIVLPSFNAASLFPPVDSWIPPMKLIRDKYITKRYVFDASKLAALKAKAASVGVQQPTRVEAVTALIWKCTMNVSRSIRGIPRLAMLSHSVNLRKRVVPPMPENTIGNIVGMFFPAHSTEKEIDLQGLVSKIKKEVREFNKSALQTINVEKKTWHKMCGIDIHERDDIDLFTYTSWCRFPLYDADFGWGKPTWVTLPNIMLKDLVVLVDTRDGEGIEALVTMSKEDMAVFERDQELLQFAAFNPSVLNSAS